MVVQNSCNVHGVDVDNSVIELVDENSNNDNPLCNAGLSILN